MTFVGCSVPERCVNPLFEVFDGGDFVLSSYRDVEEDFNRLRIYLEPGSGPDAAEGASAALRAALDVVGVEAEIETGEIPDEDWKYSYRRFFKTEPVGRRLLIVPAWETNRERIVIDPGLAFGTGRHETTKACLEYIDELAGEGFTGSFLDMGCGSGILSIAAAKLGFSPVEGFDIDETAVESAVANAAENGVGVSYRRFALGRGEAPPSGAPYDVVAANILGPLLVRFAGEIAPYVGRRLIASGILSEMYSEVVAAFAAQGFAEISRKTLGEWTTGLFAARGSA